MEERMRIDNPSEEYCASCMYRRGVTCTKNKLYGKPVPVLTVTMCYKYERMKEDTK